MLIRIDTMGPKGINIITIKQHAYITSYNIRIPVDIKPYSLRVRKVVKATNNILVKPDK
jgi:hypothetical protein